MILSLDEHTPRTEDAAFVADNARVIGRVTLGVDASVWFGVVMRGDVEDIRVGARSNIQDGTVVHADEGFPAQIGDDVTVGHKVMLHGCIVEPNTLIGIGSIILNGARIGRDSIVGANSLITEGKSFPPRSLIMGSPGKVVRELTDEEVSAIQASAGHYVANARRFAQGLKEVL